MEKINVNQLIGDYTPQGEDVLNVEDWYAWEFRTVDESFDPDHEATLAWLYSQGWGPNDDVPAVSGRHALKRKRLDTQRVLGELIQQTTLAYNAGRTINDNRFDDLVSIWAATLDRTEDEMNALFSDETIQTEYMEDVINKLLTDYNTHYGDVNGALDDWGTAEESRINDGFDDLIASQRQSVIDRKMFYSTVWDPILAGLRNERDEALNDLSDRQTRARLDEDNRLYTFKQNMRDRIFAAWGRLLDQVHKQGEARATMRNRVMDLLANFAERRNDGYPSIGEIANMATNIGASAPGQFTP